MMFIRNKVTQEINNGKIKYIVSIEFDKEYKAYNWLNYQIEKFEQFLKEKREIKRMLNSIDRDLKILDEFEADLQKPNENVVVPGKNYVSEKFKNDSIKKLNSLKNEYEDISNKILLNTEGFKSFLEEGRISCNPGTLNPLNEDKINLENRKKQIEKEIKNLDMQISGYIVVDNLDKCAEAYVNRIVKFNDGTEILIIYGKVENYNCVSPDEELGKRLYRKKVHDKIVFPNDGVEREIIEIKKYKKG